MEKLKQLTTIQKAIAGAVVAIILIGGFVWFRISTGDISGTWQASPDADFPFSFVAKEDKFVISAEIEYEEATGWFSSETVTETVDGLSGTINKLSRTLTVDEANADLEGYGSDLVGQKISYKVSDGSLTLSFADSDATMTFEK